MISALSRGSARCFPELPHKRQLLVQVGGDRQGAEVKLSPLVRISLLLALARSSGSKLSKSIGQLAGQLLPLCRVTMTCPSGRKSLPG